MTTIPPDEMKRRHQLSSRYRKAQKRAKIDEEIRSIRTAVNILIAKEKELQIESDKLKPARKHE
jgi:hypothetical protein